MRGKMKIYQYKGKQYTLDELAAESGICKNTIARRLRNGESVEQAVEPAGVPRSRGRRLKKYKVGEFEGTMKELAEHFDINEATLYGRLQRGWAIEDAVIPPKMQEAVCPEDAEILESSSYRIIYKVIFVDGSVHEGTTRALAAKFGISDAIVWRRIRLGWTFEDALTTPTRKPEDLNRYTAFGFTGTLPALADHFEVPYRKVYRYILNRGMSPEHAISACLGEIPESMVKEAAEELAAINSLCRELAAKYGTPPKTLVKNLSQGEDYEKLARYLLQRKLLQDTRSGK